MENYEPHAFEVEQLVQAMDTTSNREYGIVNEIGLVADVRSPGRIQVNFAAGARWVAPGQINEITPGEVCIMTHSLRTRLAESQSREDAAREHVRLLQARIARGAHAVPIKTACKFCGYNGGGYWLAGVHENDCPINRYATSPRQFQEPDGPCAACEISDATGGDDHGRKHTCNPAPRPKDGGAP